MIRTPSTPNSRQSLWVATLGWLAAGSVLLTSPLVPGYSAVAGWSGAFWLVVAPAIMMLALRPALPRQWLAPGARRRPVRRAAWQ